jgi:hypothetical protein
LLIVFALAGDSTMTTFIGAIAGLPNQQKARVLPARGRRIGQKTAQSQITQVLGDDPDSGSFARFVCISTIIHR